MDRARPVMRTPTLTTCLPIVNPRQAAQGGGLIWRRCRRLEPGARARPPSTSAPATPSAPSSAMSVLLSPFSWPGSRSASTCRSSHLKFNLTCFVEDSEIAERTKSEMNFDILHRAREANVPLPLSAVRPVAAGSEERRVALMLPQTFPLALCRSSCRLGLLRREQSRDLGGMKEGPSIGKGCGRSATGKPFSQKRVRFHLLSPIDPSRLRP